MDSIELLSREMQKNPLSINESACNEKSVINNSER